MYCRQRKTSAMHEEGAVENKIVKIYGLAGPPIGGVLACVLFWATRFFEGGLTVSSYGSQFEMLVAILGSFPAFAVMGYLVGGIQALLTGLLIRKLSGEQGTFSYQTALFSPLVVGIVLGLPLAFGYVFSVGYAPISALLVLVTVGTLSSLIVRFLFRKRFSPKASGL